MTLKMQTKPEPLKNHWSDDHLLEASNELELRPAAADNDDDDAPRVVLLQLEPALG